MAHKLVVETDEFGRKLVYVDDVEIDNAVDIEISAEPKEFTAKLTLIFMEVKGDMIDIQLHGEENKGVNNE
jgi:hypothetical protein